MSPFKFYENTISPQFISINFKWYFLAFHNIINKAKLNAGKGLMWIKKVDGEILKNPMSNRMFSRASVLYSFHCHFKIDGFLCQDTCVPLEHLSDSSEKIVSAFDLNVY